MRGEPGADVVADQICLAARVQPGLVNMRRFGLGVMRGEPGAYVDAGELQSAPPASSQAL